MTVQFQLIQTPPEVKKTGFLGEFCIYDHVNAVAYAVSPSNMVCFMNGGRLHGIKVKNPVFA